MPWSDSWWSDKGISLGGNKVAWMKWKIEQAIFGFHSDMHTMQ